MSKNFLAALITAVVGLADSVYLTWAKLSHSSILCIQSAVTDCNLVNSSSYSQWHGIPVALLGVAGYVSIIALLIISLGKRFSQLAAWVLFGITTFGFIYSLYLSYVEIFILKAICQWCMVSALAMTLLFVLSILMIRRTKFFSNSF